MTDERPSRTATPTEDSADRGVETPPTADDPTSADRGDGGQPASAARTALWAVARAVVVLAVAGAVYPFVIPQSTVERSRLAQLVPDHPGLPAFAHTKAQRGEQNDAATGLAALTAAARRAPHRTGLYSIEWASSSTSAVGDVAFLLPDAASATATQKQLVTQQLAAGSYASDSLRRTSTFTVAGVPGSQGSVYSPASRSAGAPPGLAVAVFRSGPMVAVSEVAGGGASEASTVARTEMARLQAAGSGFSLEVTRYPAVATAVWAGGAAVLAALAALVPVARRRRAERRRRQIEAEMANRVRVGNRVITKRRA